MKKNELQKIIKREIKKILKENWHVNPKGGFPGPPIDSDPYGDLPEPEAEFGDWDDPYGDLPEPEAEFGDWDDPDGDLPEPKAEFGKEMEICPECGGAGCRECHGEGVIEIGGFGGREI